jgi:hypothetical protein
LNLNRIVPTISVPRYHIADSFPKEKAYEAHFPSVLGHEVRALRHEVGHVSNGDMVGPAWLQVVLITFVIFDRAGEPLPPPSGAR